MYTNVNLFDANVHYWPFYPTNVFICNKVIKKQEITNNSHLSLSNYSIENMLVKRTVPYKIDASFTETQSYNTQYNQKIFMNNSLDNYVECPINSPPPFSIGNDQVASECNQQQQQQLQSSASQESDPNDQYARHEIYSRSRWTREEENELIKIIKKIGAKKWNKIAEFMKNRTAKQCRDHYANCLNPNIKKSLWTFDEEKILIEKYQEYGTRWSIIKRYLPGRTTSMIKNYMRMILKNVENQKSHKSQITLTTNNLNDSNDDSSSYSMNSTASENEDQNLSLPFTDDQEKFNDFNYHSIVGLLNQPSK